MKTQHLATLLLLFVSCQTYNLTLTSLTGDFSSFDSVNGSVPLSDLITVANYFGCKTWNKSLCTECSQGYSFNQNGVCCEVDTYCSKFNTAVGICEGCYQGYVISNGMCTLAAQDTGCQNWQGNTCTNCSKRWYFNSNNVCQPVSDLCYTWDAQGSCLSCYGGYIISNGVCSINTQQSSSVNGNPLCQTWVGAVCSSCATRANFDQNGICQAVDSQCQTWDSKSGLCLTCYGGYVISNGKCVVSAVSRPVDIGCSSWNWNAQICLQCSSRWYFSTVNKACASVSDLCLTYDQNNGNCVSCYQGYTLGNGVCSLSSTQQQVTDPGCSLWDWNSQVCLKCSQSWVLVGKTCKAISSLCASSDANGVCLSCYIGYSLSNGVCSLSALQQVSDIGCAQWDWKNQVCLACSINWVFNSNKVCTPVSSLCATSSSTGVCLSCYKGYNLANGVCSLAPVQQVSDVGCAQWDWNNQVCLTCSQGYAFNANKVCVQVNSLCSSSNSAGACTACYNGYILSSGVCSLAPIQKVSDVGCAQWDWNNQVCISCSQGWVFSTNKICTPVNSQCASSNSAGVCTSCYQGYNLNNGVCALAPIQQVSDAGCALWDWGKLNCLQCSKNWIFNSNNLCVQVNSQCATSNAQGVCLTCYLGYIIDGKGGCAVAAQPKVSDVGCNYWDWTKQVCLQCSDRWFMNSQKICTPVSDNCQSWDNINGACISCYKGYNLNNGVCIVAPVQQISDPGCAQWNWNNQTCLQCSSRWYLSTSGKCAQISDSCQTYNSQGACLSCYTGYTLNGNTCQAAVAGNSLCQ